MTDTEQTDELEIRRIVRLVLMGLVISHLGIGNFDPIYFGRVLAFHYLAGVLPGSLRTVARIAAQEYIGDSADQDSSIDHRTCRDSILAGLEFKVKQAKQATPKTSV